jgi:hypothetical protein
MSSRSQRPDAAQASAWTSCPRSPLNVVHIPGKAVSGRSSFSANQTTSFFFVSGFGSGAYSAKLLNGTRQRFSGLSDGPQQGDGTSQPHHAFVIVGTNQLGDEIMPRRYIERMGPYQSLALLAAPLALSSP